MKVTKMSDLIVYKLMQKEIEEALWKSQDERIKEELSVPHTGELIQDEELREIIRNFTMIFKSSFTNEQVRHMNYKLTFLRFRDTENTQLVGKFISLGNYNSLNNVITIVHINRPKITKMLQEETYYHELLHMASTVRTKDKHYVGFEIPGVFGRKLNEGYTEYLTRKYFTRGNEYVQTSDIGIIMAKGIENIIGREKMQEYFFNGNLDQLIEDLSQYSTREEIIKLIFLMDRLDSKFKVAKDIDDIIREIAILNKRKLQKDYEEGKLTDEEFLLEKLMKVDHYRVRNLWSEQTQVIESGDSFYLEDQGFKSRTYKKLNVNKVKIKCKQ